MKESYQGGREADHEVYVWHAGSPSTHLAPVLTILPNKAGILWFINALVGVAVRLLAMSGPQPDPDPLSLARASAAQTRNSKKKILPTLTDP